MSKPMFQWSPDLGAEQGVTPNVKVTKFGDGYEIRNPIGLNSQPKKWRNKFTNPAAVTTAILAFLEARNATEAFEWVDPLGKTAIYVCRNWTCAQNNFGLYVVNAEFEQVFEY